MIRAFALWPLWILYQTCAIQILQVLSWRIKVKLFRMFQRKCCTDFTFVSFWYPTRTCIGILYLPFKVNISFTHARLSKTLLYYGLVYWWLKPSDAKFFLKIHQQMHIEHPLLLFTAFEILHCHASVSGWILLESWKRKNFKNMFARWTPCSVVYEFML